MTCRSYYNEFDPYAAQWLRNLIAAGHLPAGDVDDRDIREVRASDLDGYAQCHFFAGIGGWPLALKLAGIPDDFPVWSGSCPCQPLSSAGKRQGHADERHLWPAFHRLIAERAPAIVLGEQVASADGREWFAGVRADLEALGYACGAADLCAAGVGAPHIRQRLFWVADAADERRPGGREQPRHTGDEPGQGASPLRRGGPRGLAHADGGLAGHRDVQRGGQHGQQPQDGGAGGVEYPNRSRTSAPSGDNRQAGEEALRRTRANDGTAVSGGAGAPGGFWAAADWLPCTDGKARRVEPGTFPLAHGVPGRVGRLRAYGNAIVPQVAKWFIESLDRLPSKADKSSQ